MIDAGVFYFNKPIYKADGNEVKKYWVLGVQDIDFKTCECELLIIEDTHDPTTYPEIVNIKDLFGNFYDTEDKAKLNCLPF